MPSLELKVPPPIIAVLVCAAMWGLSFIPPTLDLPFAVRLGVALLIAAVGGGFSKAGSTCFRRAKTTSSPLKPQKASALVTTGIYRFTRNPMYLGVLFVVLGWAAFLCSLWALLFGPAALVLYLTFFQIRPEERILAGLFGAEYTAYRLRVRRWI